MTKARGWVGIGIVFLVGCSSSGSKSMGTGGANGGTSGGGTGGMGGAGGSAVTIGNFAQRYAEALCTKNFTCCSASDLADHTQSQCLMDNASVISALTAQIDASQAQGRATYDVAASASCIDALNAMTCDEFKQGIDANADACMSFVVPNVAIGGACSQSYECTTNNCVGWSTDPAHDGTCAAARTLAAIGTACAASDCVDGAFCDSTYTCRKKKAAGETCTLADECVNSCNTTTGTCSCYAGCSVVEAASTGGTVLSALLLGAGVVLAHKRRRRRGR